MSNYMIYLVPAYAIGLFILINKSNVKEKYRYYQMQNVIILFIISLICLVGNVVIIASYADKLSLILTNITGLTTWLPLANQLTALIITLNVIIVSIFAVIKVGRKVKFEQMLLQGEKNGDVYPKYFDNKYLGYKKDKIGKVVLENDWVITQRTIKWLNIGAVVFFSLNFIALLFITGKSGNTSMFTPHYRLAFYPFLGMLLIGEIHYYLSGELSGEVSKQKIEEVKEKIEEEKTFDYDSIYERYKTTWQENLLVSGKFTNNIFDNDDYKNIKIESKSSNVQKIYAQLEEKNLKCSSNFYIILEKMLEGKNLLIQNANYEEISPILFSFFNEAIINGKKILVLVEESTYANVDQRNEIKNWFNKCFENIYKNSLRSIVTFEEWQEQKKWNIVISTQNAIIKSKEKFIKKLSEKGSEVDFEDLTILVMSDSTQEISENIISLSMLSDVLNAHFRFGVNSNEKRAQYIIMANGAKNLKSSIENNLGINLEAYNIENKKSKNIYAMFWKRDTDDSYYSKICYGTNNDTGVSATLSYIAWEMGLNNINFAEQAKIPYNIYQENVKNISKDRLRAEVIDPNKLSGNYKEKVKNNILTSLIKKEKDKFIFVEDTENNLPLALKKFDYLGKENSYVNIISSNYLFRDYFVDNMDYFYITPMHVYTPDIEADKYKVATYLKEILTNSSLKIYDEEIKRELSKIIKNIENVQEELIKLFDEIYKIDIVKKNYLTVKEENVFNYDKSEYERKNQYELNLGINGEESLIWFENFKIEDTSRKECGEISYDYLYQNYLLGQVHNFDGISYKISSIKREDKKIEIERVEVQGFKSYRNKDTIKIHSFAKDVSDVKGQEKTNDYTITQTVKNMKYTINTEGYFEIEEEKNSKNSKLVYMPLSEPIAKRDYENGKLLEMTFSLNNKKIEEPKKVALALGVILTELFKTIFPGNYKYIKIFTMFNEKTGTNSLDKECTLLEEVSHILPSKIILDSNVKLKENKENEVTIYFIEDTHRDVGVLKTISENRTAILYEVQDYLTWLNESNKKYMICDGKDIRDILDLKNTQNFLNSLLGTDNVQTKSRKSVKNRKFEHYNQEKIQGKVINEKINSNPKLSEKVQEDNIAKNNFKDQIQEYSDEQSKQFKQTDNKVKTFNNGGNPMKKWIIAILIVVTLVGVYTLINPKIDSSNSSKIEIKSDLENSISKIEKIAIENIDQRENELKIAESSFSGKKVKVIGWIAEKESKVKLTESDMLEIELKIGAKITPDSEKALKEAEDILMEIKSSLAKVQAESEMIIKNSEYSLSDSKAKNLNSTNILGERIKSLRNGLLDAKITDNYKNGIQRELNTILENSEKEKNTILDITGKVMAESAVLDKNMENFDTKIKNSIEKIKNKLNIAVEKSKIQAIVVPKEEPVKKLAKEDVNPANNVSKENSKKLLLGIMSNKVNSLNGIDTATVDINYANEEGITPLIAAINNKNVELVKTIILNGANVNKNDAYKTSPLMYATYKGNLEIIEILLKNGAKKMSKDEFGENAYDRAYGNKKVLELLNRY
ncbi:MAG: ankyrin repeat domain-containing protein [Leptotrichiaceae bacterium]|nr:ankyrin repeat domain-containing protein [Leptotrichiaceae bacterium]